MDAATGRLSYALADQVTYSLGNMIIMAVFSRHTSQREFGMYVLTQRAMDVLIQLCTVFFWAPFSFNLPGTEESRQKLYLGSIVAQQCVSCVFFGFAFWVLSKWSSTPSRGLYYGVFAPLIVTSAGMLFREFTRRMYFAELRFKAAFWTEVATVALQAGGVEWLSLQHRLSVTSAMWIIAVGAMVVNLYWLLTEWNTFQVCVQDTIRDLVLNFRMGRWLLGGNMVSLVSMQCNPWLLGAFLGPASIGAYAVCESVVNIPRVALNSLQNVMAPTMARSLAQEGKPKLKQVVARFDRALLFGSAGFAALIVAFGPWVAHLIFSRFPGNGRLVLLFLAVNFVAVASRLAQSYGLTAIDKAGLVFYANAIGLVLQIAAAFFFIARFGVTGAAMAMMLGSLVMLLIRQMFWRREMRLA